MHALLVAEQASRLPSEVHQVLARRGHDVTSTPSLQHALALQRAAPADILVVDWNTARRSSAPLNQELLRTTHEKDSAVLAIVRPESGELEDALSAGVNDYLSLPLAARAVEARIAVVERWLEQLRSHRTPSCAPPFHHPFLEPDFRAILDACPEPICIHRNRKVLYANPSLAASLGCSGPAALLGATISSLIHPGDRDAVEQRLATIERTGQPAALREERFVALDGSLRVGEAHSFLIHFDDGPAIASLGRDLTERRAFEARFHHSERLASVGALAASVAHELNNPLTLVLCNLADLSRNIPPLAVQVPEPTVHHLERRVQAIEEAAGQMRALAHDLTDFVRAKEAASQRVDLGALLERALRMVAPHAKDRAHATLDSKLDHATFVEGSETRLLQVFLNLLLNAVDALAELPAGAVREIFLAMERAGSEVVVTVADSGPGVPRELRERIFESFFSSKERGKGTGLGLAVARSIVEGLGGKIALLDTPRGATFEVRLPCVD